MDNTEDVIMNGETVNSNFGKCVSSAGDVNGDGYDDVIVGAFGFSSIGKAYIFLGGSVMNGITDLLITNDETPDYFGWYVSEAGDVNGDGYSDVIVGSPSSPGKAYVYFGGVALDNTADVIMTGESGSFGSDVSSAGDINGDGFSDMIVSSYGYSISTGKAYIYLGSAKTPITIKFKMFIEGFYNSVSNLQVSDTVNVELRSPTSPFAVVDQIKVTSRSDGNALLTFLNAPSGNYFITVKHRNSIETWSANAIAVTSGSIGSYNFSVSLAQAFGNNMTQIDISPSKFGIYSGDENQDGSVNLTDVVKVSNNASAFVAKIAP